MVWQEIQIIQILCAYIGFCYKTLHYNSEYCYLQEEYKEKDRKQQYFFVLPHACSECISQTLLPQEEKIKIEQERKERKQRFPKISASASPPGVHSRMHFCFLLQDGEGKLFFNPLSLQALLCKCLHKCLKTL